MLIYLFQVTLTWSACAILYILLLRKSTFHVTNRIYLLFTMAAGLLLPLIGSQIINSASIPDLPIADTVSSALKKADQQTMTRAADWSWFNLLAGVWMIGAMVGLVRLLRGLYQIYNMAHHAIPMVRPEGDRLLYTDETALPCTFFNRIFVPITFDTMPDADDMLAHERGHARQAHTIDVLLAELLCVVFWWHPLAYWFRRSLRLVHEYLADAMAIRHSSRQQYGRLLIRQAQSGPALAIVHHFYQSPLKQRLVMLTKHNSSSRSGWKYALLLPVLALVLCFCRATDDLSDPDVAASFPGGTEMLMKYLGNNIRYPESSKNANSEGKVFIRFFVEKDGKITEPTCINADKIADKALIDEAIRVVSAMPQWEPGVKNSKPVKTQFVLPIGFKLTNK